MKLYMLECDGGFVKEELNVYRSVSIEEATVVNQDGFSELEITAAAAKNAGLANIRLVELFIAEGECIKKF